MCPLFLCPVCFSLVPPQTIMYLMYTLDADGKRVYTLKVRDRQGGSGDRSARGRRRNAAAAAAGAAVWATTLAATAIPPCQHVLCHTSTYYVRMRCEGRRRARRAVARGSREEENDGRMQEAHRPTLPLTNRKTSTAPPPRPPTLPASPRTTSSRASASNASAGLACCRRKSRRPCCEEGEREVVRKGAFHFVLICVCL